MKAKIRKTRIIGFGLIGIAVIAAWLLVLGPRAQKPSSLDMQKVQAFAQKATLDKKVLTLIAAKNQIPAAEQQIALLAQKFPKEAGVIELQSEITAMVNKAGISTANILSITVAKPTLNATGDSADMNVSVSISGNYSQLSQFVNSLYNIKRGIAIESVSLSSNTTTTKGSSSYVLNLSAKTFLLQPVTAIPPKLLR